MIPKQMVGMLVYRGVNHDILLSLMITNGSKVFIYTPEYIFELSWGELTLKVIVPV